MKRILFSSVLLFLYSFVAGQAGIYVTADDYLTGNLEYRKGDARKHAIRADIPFNPSAVKVVQGSEKYELDKWNLYGYRNKRNQVFRFYESKTFRIVDPTHFPIYAREENIVNGKEKFRTTKYYFSTHPSAPVIELSIPNLKMAFGHRDFHDMLDLHFNSNSELLAFDEHHGEYRLKSVFYRTFY